MPHLLVFCEHRASETYPKVLALSHLSKGHSSRDFVVCQNAFWILQVQTDETQLWSSPLISLEVVRGSLVSICMIGPLNLWSIFHLHSHLRRLATVLWRLHFWLTYATVFTRASSWLEVVLEQTCPNYSPRPTAKPPNVSCLPVVTTIMSRLVVHFFSVATQGPAANK